MDDEGIRQTIAVVSELLIPFILALIGIFVLAIKESKPMSPPAVYVLGGMVLLSLFYLLFKTPSILLFVLIVLFVCCSFWLVTKFAQRLNK